jgi:hypothetical protein
MPSLEDAKITIRVPMLTPADYQEIFTDRERALVEHAVRYSRNPFGCTGHNDLIVIAKFAHLFGLDEGVR